MDDLEGRGAVVQILALLHRLRRDSDRLLDAAMEEILRAEHGSRLDWSSYPRCATQREIRDLDDLWRFLGGPREFVVRLLALIAAADQDERQRLAVLYPHQVAAYCTFAAIGRPCTAGWLVDELSVQGSMAAR